MVLGNDKIKLSSICAVARKAITTPQSYLSFTSLKVVCRAQVSLCFYAQFARLQCQMLWPRFEQDLGIFGSIPKDDTTASRTVLRRMPRAGRHERARFSRWAIRKRYLLALNDQVGGDMDWCYRCWSVSL